jgi:1-acyl-sn-glycerol-3-phosphate acyltransferase
MTLFPEATILVHYLLARVPVVGFLLKSSGAVFVQRRTFGRSRRELDEKLKRNDGRDIIVLPEGAPSRDGSIGPFRRGFIHILRREPMDLLPVTLNGFYTLKPRFRPYLDPEAELEVIIHQPISSAAIAALGDKQLLDATLRMIEGSYRP